MRRPEVNPDAINTLADLKAYQKRMKAAYLFLGEEIKADLLYKASHPFSLLKRKKRVVDAATGGGVLSSAASMLSEMAGQAVRKLFPKKWGFLEKWLLGRLARTTVKKLIDKKAACNLKEGFIPLPIRMDQTVINQPDAK